MQLKCSKIKVNELQGVSPSRCCHRKKSCWAVLITTFQNLTNFMIYLFPKFHMKSFRNFASYFANKRTNNNGQNVSPANRRRRWWSFRQHLPSLPRQLGCEALETSRDNSWGSGWLQRPDSSCRRPAYTPCTGVLSTSSATTSCTPTET